MLKYLLTPSADLDSKDSYAYTEVSSSLIFVAFSLYWDSISFSLYLGSNSGNTGVFAILYESCKDFQKHDRIQS